MARRILRGTVVWLDFEGGFWGIVGDDGEKYRPVDPLPEEARGEGTRVDVELEQAALLSFAMWGRSARIHRLRVVNGK